MQIQCSHCTLVQSAPADVCKRCGHSFRAILKNRKQKVRHNLFVGGLIVFLILMGGGVYLKTNFPGAISSLLGTANSNISREDLSIMGEAPSILELSGILINI